MFQCGSYAPRPEEVVFLFDFVINIGRAVCSLFAVLSFFFGHDFPFALGAFPQYRVTICWLLGLVGLIDTSFSLFVEESGGKWWKVEMDDAQKAH